MPDTNEVWYTISLDGDRGIYGRGGVRLAPGSQAKTVDKAIALFRQLREKFQPDLEAAMAPPKDWLWTEGVVRRLPFKVLVQHITSGESAEVPFPIERDFSGFDTTGRMLGEVLAENSGLVSWLAYDCTKEVEIDKVFWKTKLGVAAARVLLKAAVAEKLAEEEDF